MKIKKLHIKNFKSIADLEIIEPNPFTVFVGPNGSGKSNIFEALEYATISFRFPDNRQQFARSIFGQIEHFQLEDDDVDDFNSPIMVFESGFELGLGYLHSGLRPESEAINYIYEPEFKKFVNGFSVIFPNNFKRERFILRDDITLSLSCSNLEKVLKRILKDENKKEESLEWLQLFIPEFENVYIESSDLSKTDTLVVKEKHSKKPFTKDLISDGTYNILALLTAVFQSDEPQFLCIEEPENGLNPRVIKELVGFFRNACEEKGHYIWLNTHSQTLVSELTPDEIITVDKIKGETKIKQFKGEDFHGLSMDEAWLTNTLGGGLPW